ncbi:MAG: 1-deoxy-D-xylulose-5-phosphate reductoisomerase [Peptococcia bacterium]|jgi:1-deoxy-D-xylulose-5-phosphate reductoisomerase
MATKVKKIVLLGSTGSVGRQALQVIDAFPEQFEIIGLAAGGNLELLAAQVEKYRPLAVSIGSEKDINCFKELLSGRGTKLPALLCGRDGLVSLAQTPELEILLVAVSGINGLEPTLAALKKQKTVALANKETIVTAGALVMETAHENGARLIPVDSEHSAIFQCIEEENRGAIDKLLLTASGGPFLAYSAEELGQVTPEMALKHPNWKMGAKITVDCAGLINKGLEVIEAHWLFNMPYEKIEVLIHPQSIIHSMVQYEDGAVLAQLGSPDMRVPIQYALTYPYRKANPFPKLDFTQLPALSFQKPDTERFPGLLLAYTAGKTGGTMPTVYNGANEEAVRFFLQNRIRFVDIPHIIEKVMEWHEPLATFGLEEIVEIDRWAREQVSRVIAAL